MEVALEDLDGGKQVLKKDSVKGFDGVEEKKTQRLRGNATPGFFSSLLFYFVDPLVRLGKRERLENEDLLLRPDMRTRVLYERFGDAWEREKKKPKPSILKALVSGTWKYLLFTGFLYLITIVLQFVGPLMLNRIVAGLTCRSVDADEERDCPTRKELFQYATVLFVAPLFQALAESHMFYQLNLYGARLRNGLMSAIYR